MLFRSGDATGAQAANGWRCHGAGWDITWQVLRGREGMGVRENGAGLPSAEPAALIRDDGAIHKVFVSVPCAAPGPMAWSFRREPLEPGVAPGEIFVGEGPGGMVQVSEDDLLIYKSAQKGRAEAEREARRLLDEQLVRIGRSVRTGHPEFDAPIRSRAANPAELARRVEIGRAHV